MNATCNTAALLAALRFAARATDARSTMPALSHVVLRVDGSALTVTGTDLLRCASTTVEATATKPGALVLPAKRLVDTLASLSAESVTISSGKAQHAQIKAGRVEVSLVGLPERDAPTVPRLDAPGVPVSASTLAAMIDRVDDAVCLDETRHHLAGANLEIEGATWRLVTTDGHRMAVTERELVPLATKPVIVPRLGLAQLRGLAAEAGDETIDIAIASPWIRATHGAAQLLIKLIDAQFPPWRQVVPKKPSQKITIGREALLAAVKRCALMASDTRGVRFAVEDGAINLSSDNPDHGNVRESVEIEGGEELTIGFSPKYALQALAAYESDDVVVELSGSLDPVLIRPTGADSSFSVVMPMRI